MAPGIKFRFVFNNTIYIIKVKKYYKSLIIIVFKGGLMALSQVFKREYEDYTWGYGQNPI